MRDKTNRREDRAELLWLTWPLTLLQADWDARYRSIPQCRERCHVATIALQAGGVNTWSVGDWDVTGQWLNTCEFLSLSDTVRQQSGVNVTSLLSERRTDRHAKWVSRSANRLNRLATPITRYILAGNSCSTWSQHFLFLVCSQNCEKRLLDSSCLSVPINWTELLLLLLLLLLLSSSSSSSSSISSLCRVSTLIFLRQTMSLGNTVLQLFWCYYSWCSYH